MSFNRSGQLYYYNPGDLAVQIGDRVLIPTEGAPEVAEVMWAAQWVSEDTDGFPTLVGMATPDELDRATTVRRLKAKARVATKRLIKAHELPMKLVGVDILVPAGAIIHDQVTIFFSAAHRVDFRALVRDLGATLNSKVELRQLSARDEAKLSGSIGSCGRELCCSTFLKDFEPVTLRMAKDQDLPMNPLRISGACGRLMCCLKYEHPLYERFKADAPAVGERVETEQGSGVVMGHNVPSESVSVRLDDGGGSCACSLASVCGSRQDYEARYTD
ncbi:MAG: regulatory iron-sulfur-containing complex subunit RicT [Antricoccus sp.]